MIQSLLGLAVLLGVALALEWRMWRQAKLPTRVVALLLVGLALGGYLLQLLAPALPRPATLLYGMLEPFSIRED